ncbi:hypothetical protein ABPG75_009860 [Micractinium tetrahymenae]
MQNMSLFLGTTSGLFLRPAGRPASLIGLDGSLVTHLAAAGERVAAAVPVPGPVHKMYTADHAPSADAPWASGMHLLHPSGTTSDAPAAYTADRVWQGDVRSCCAWAGGQGLAVGTEPADVFVSLDGGRSWSAGAAGFAAAPSRSKWSFPAPPHEPHVLSIEHLAAGDAGSEAASKAGQLVAGIEVGGVLVSSLASSSSDGGGADTWEEQSEGLYVDVHSCRIDPFHASHMLAVTGRGLYATGNGGKHWEAQGSWAGRYTVGLAFNPERQGEVLVTAGDRPPAIGAHVYHSTDGGRSFEDITPAGECGQTLGSRTPVPYFLAGSALLGTGTGALLGASDAARHDWRVIDRLPHPICCMVALGQSPSSVMH